MNPQEKAALFILVVTGILIFITIVSFALRCRVQKKELKEFSMSIPCLTKKKKENE